MKDYEISHESMLLSPENYNLPLYLSSQEASANMKYIETDIRNGLSNSLGNLCHSVRILLLLLEENNIINLLPEVALPQYFEALDKITQGAVDSVTQITKSQEFDGMKFLDTYPEFECNILQ